MVLASFRSLHLTELPGAVLAQTPSPARKTLSSQRPRQQSAIELRSLAACCGALKSVESWDPGLLDCCGFQPDSGTLAIPDSKSGKPRHIVLSADGLEFFEMVTAGRVGIEPIFLKTDGSRWLPDHQSDPIAETNKRAKILPPINFHGLRHTWASHAVMNGMPLMVVARNLGHSDTRMVEKHYGHLAPSYIADAVRAHAPRFGSANGKIKRLHRGRAKTAKCHEVRSPWPINGLTCGIAQSAASGLVRLGWSTRPVLGLGLDPVFGVFFRCEVTDMGVGAVAGFAGDEPAFASRRVGTWHQITLLKSELLNSSAREMFLLALNEEVNWRWR
jgi:hypothetical protein